VADVAEHGVDDVSLGALDVDFAPVGRPCVSPGFWPWIVRALSKTVARADMRAGSPSILRSRR